MGGYWSEEKKEEDILPKERKSKKRSCEEFKYTNNPILVPTDYSKVPYKMYITPTNESSFDMKNYGVLPDLVITKISLFLPLDDLTRVFRTCRLFYHCSNSHFFWREYYHVTFFGDVERQVEMEEDERKRTNWKKHFYMRHHLYPDVYYRKKYIPGRYHNESTGQPHHLKCVFLGRAGVGKTSFVQRVSRDEWHEFYECTIGAAFLTRLFVCTKTNRSYSLDLWDTGGQERYLSLAPMYYRGCDIAFLCFSIDNYESFEHPDSSFRMFLRELKKNRIGDSDPEDQPVVILMGMKSDLENPLQEDDSSRGSRRKVRTEEAIAFVKQNSDCVHGYVENSSKTGMNVMVTVGIAMDLTSKRLAFIEGGEDDLFFEEDLSKINREVAK